MAGKVAYSAKLSQLLAMGTSVVNVDSTSMTEAVGLATVILAVVKVELSSAICFLLIGFLYE